jgi:PAS domain S-box-containing protein
MNEVTKDPSRRLAEINRAITTSLDFDEVLDLIVDNAAHLVNARITALLLTGKDGLLRVRAAYGLKREQTRAFFGRMEEDVIKELHKSLGLGRGETLTSVPVIAMNALTGLLVIVRDSPLAAEEDWQLSALADQAAIALRNARLHELELSEASRERNQTLDALRESNDRINTILESITDLFYRLDREWRFVEVNRQTELRLKKRREELLGKAIWDVYPSAVNTKLFNQFHKAIEVMEPVHFDMESVIVPGAWFEIHGYPSPAGLTVYLRDISERKHAEITSRLLASIVESSSDAIVSKDLTGRILTWNKGAERIFGYTEAEAVGQNVTMLIPEDRFDEEPAILRRIAQGKNVEHYETVRRRKDGSMIDISLTISPIHDDRGNVIGASKIARDISDRRRREREIRFQADLIGAVEQGVIATDLNGEILYWNNFAERLFGWTAEEALGANVIDIVPVEEMRELAAQIMDRIRKGESWSGEFMARSKYGRVFPLMVTDSPLFDDLGNLIGVVGVSTDISERKRAEQERQQLLEREREARNEAETANRLKDEFLATLSHELRNPLNVILGYSEVLIRSAEVKQSPFIMKAAEVIRRNALAQAQLVRDLLDLSRLHMGKLTLNRESVSLPMVVDNAVETVRAEAATKNITIRVETTDDIIFVDADQLRLEQIIWNLLNNGVKFTPQGGSVTVRLSRDAGHAHLDVEDTGEGIDPAFMPHVFEMFRQADATSSRKHGGMGIGLALVEQLVSLHEGSISVSSEGRGKGAKFSVEFPLSREVPGTENIADHDGEGALRDMRILVVDDSADTTDMLKRLFEMDGAEVVTARSGGEALNILARQTFDVILSDISMPGMDGFELLRRLRAIPGRKDIPVLALTGFGRAEDVERAESQGFFSHVTKPIDVAELVEILGTLQAKT